MKTSWIIGVAMMYLLIFGLEIMITGGISFNNNVTSNQTTLMLSENQTSSSGGWIAESSNQFTGAWSIITKIGSYLKVIIPMFALYEPTVFSGYMIWIWVFICFPVDIGMVFAIITIARGVHAG